MTEMAGAGVDDDHGWTERLAWAYGLIAPAPAERAAALDRLASVQEEVESARLRLHKAWHPTPWLRCRARGRVAAQKAYDEAASRCLPEALWIRPPRALWSRQASGEINTWAGLPFALLFLEWEARYPQEWTQHAKEWGTKQSLIRMLATAVTSAGVVYRRPLGDLVLRLCGEFGGQDGVVGF
ncbi:hypothetical protein [Streptomyces acidicola]|uniref:hypothetical protein n=1 Tax=Streptomyces acidicola TaxID=2596892 RepID=UPI001883E554|nr:hypothetical protein [Streptomyces acidicola]